MLRFQKIIMLNKLIFLRIRLDKLVILLMIYSFLLVSSSYSNTVDYSDLIYFSSITQDSDFVPQRISVIVENQNVFTNEDTLTFEFYFNGEQLDSVCNHKIDFIQSTSTHRIIYCPIPKLENSGVLEYKIILKNAGESHTVIEDSIFYSSSNEEVSLMFTNDPRGTRVSLKVIGDDIEFPVKIFHEIPKTVIEEITKENADELIFSEQNFVIERENPIISWEVTSREQQIDYVLLNQEIDSDTKAQFRTYSHQENTLNFIVIFTILILLIIIFVPLIFKSFKSKSSV